MNATPRPHFEEIDWFDYVQGDVDAEAARELHAHLSGCPQCRGVVRDYERLARAVPAALHLVTDDGTRDNRESRDAAVLAAAVDSAREEGDPAEARRGVILAAFEGAGAGPSWDLELAEEANALCRDLLRTDVPLAGRILRSALACPGLDRGGSASLSATLAYVLRVEGDLERALETLDRVRDDLGSGSAILELELGFWHYVRATVLYNLRRLDEALGEIRAAREIYEMLEDGDRIVRCGQTEAVLLSDLDRLDEALALYRQLVEHPPAGESPSARAVLLMNYGTDLVRAGRLPDARATYARAIELLTKTGQPRFLMRVREGLSNIAIQENRLEEGLAMKIALRPDFQALSILSEDVIHELGIAELYIQLGRSADAAAICRGLLSRIEGAELHREAAKALAYLVEAERDLDVERVGRVRQFIRRVEDGADLRWTAA
jgi:tetratricopeptide (TPR) repeat protein